VVHYEQYHLPFALRSIAFAWRLYVTRSMNTELDRIALLAQPPPGQASEAELPLTLPAFDPIYDQELASTARSTSRTELDGQLTAER
jgi:hypothetical protein